jgi:hypothetical protein
MTIRYAATDPPDLVTARAPHGSGDEASANKATKDRVSGDMATGVEQPAAGRA